LSSIRYAVRNVSRRKKRNMLTVIGIALGVAMIASAQIAADTLINSFNELSFQNIGKIDVFVQPSTSTTFNESVYETLVNDENVIKYLEDGSKGISPRLEIAAFTLYPVKGQVETDVLLVGINETLDEHFGSLINKNGEKISLSPENLAFGEVIIGNNLADDLNLDLDLNRTILVGFTDASGNNTVNVPLTVIDIAKQEGKGVYNGGEFLFLPLSYARVLYNVGPQEINQIIVDTIDEEETSEKTVEAIQTAFAPDEDDYDVIPIRDNLREAAETFSFFETFLYFFGSFVIISGIILIVNIGLINVEERKRNIGILRAVGMKRKQVTTTFLAESVLLGVAAAFLGVLIGIVIGYLLALYVTSLFTENIEAFEGFTVKLLVEPSVIWSSLIAGILIAIISTIYPAIKASRVDIIETLRGIEKQEWEKAGRKSFISGFIFLFLGTTTLSFGMEGMSLLYGLIFTFIGTGLIASKFIKKRKAYNFIGISMILTATLILLTELEQESDMFLIVTTFTLITGGIILIGVNLSIVTEWINKIFSRFKSLRSIGLLSTRYVGRQPTRSSLTFAIFAVILTMSIGLAIFGGSLSQGFEDYAEEVSGDADIVAESRIPLSSTTVVGMQTLTTDDGQGQIEYIEPIPAIQIGEQNSFLFTSATSPSENRYQTPIYAAESNLTEFSFTEETWGETDEKILDEALERYGVEDPWQLLVIDARDPQGRPFMLLNHFVQLQGEGIPGDSIWLRSEDGTLQEFIVLSEPDNFPITFGAIISAKQPILGLADRVRNNLYSAFIFKTNAEKLNSEINFELAQKIEEYGNINNPEGFFYGLQAETVWEIYESFFGFFSNIITFLNSYILVGFFVGVLGLLVISLRSVSERRREIGMMRSLGFRQKQVVRAVLLEVLLVALLGLFLGIVNGIIFTYAVFSAYLTDFQYIIPWVDIAFYVGLTLVFSFIAAWYPGRKAARIPPSEALRYVG